MPHSYRCRVQGCWHSNLHMVQHNPVKPQQVGSLLNSNWSFVSTQQPPKGHCSQTWVSRGIMAELNWSGQRRMAGSPWDEASVTYREGLCPHYPLTVQQEIPCTWLRWPLQLSRLLGKVLSNPLKTRFKYLYFSPNLSYHTFREWLRGLPCPWAPCKGVQALVCKASSAQELRPENVERVRFPPPQGLPSSPVALILLQTPSKTQHRGGCKEAL